MTSLSADKEIEIVHELGERVLEQETMLNQASDVCGELDRSITVQTTWLYSLTIVAFSHLHKVLKIITSRDQALHATTSFRSKVCQRLEQVLPIPTSLPVAIHTSRATDSLLLQVLLMLGSMATRNNADSELL